MEWISTKGMTNDDAPEGQVFVQYLEPCFGYWNVEFATAYYDNPKDNKDNNGEGWLHWITDNKINVIAYAKLPEPMKNPFEGKTQKDIYEEFGTYHPNKGCIGE